MRDVPVWVNGWDRPAIVPVCSTGSEMVKDPLMTPFTLIVNVEPSAVKVTVALAVATEPALATVVATPATRLLRFQVPDPATHCITT